MANENYCDWPGLSGQVYRYWYYPMHACNLKDIAGNYIFAHLGDDGWIPDHIGETTSLKDRCCDRHEKWDRARQHGATHIHAHVNGKGRDARLAEERDLTSSFDPPCNDL